MSLTDDWKAGKLDGEFWVKLSKPTGEYIERRTFVKGVLHEEKDLCVEIVEVIAPCDYDHFVELTEKVKELEKTNKLYKSLSDNGQSAIDTNKRLTEVIEQLRDEEAYLQAAIEVAHKAYNGVVQDNNNLFTVITECELKLAQLREVLHECRPALSHLGKWNTQRQYLLTKINEVMK